AAHTASAGQARSDPVHTAGAGQDGSDAAAIPAAGRSPSRSIGATVVLVDGALAAYLARGDRQLTAWLPDAEPQRSRVGRAVARALIDRARTVIGENGAVRGMLIEDIDGLPSSIHPFAPFLAEAGFLSGA